MDIFILCLIFICILFVFIHSITRPSRCEVNCLRGELRDEVQKHEEKLRVLHASLEICERAEVVPKYKFDYLEKQVIGLEYEVKRVNEILEKKR